MAPAVRAWAVRHDRPLRADPPALFPFQSARLRHGLPARTLSRRGHGPLAPALLAARVARRSGAPPALAHGDAVRAVADPVSQNRPMAPAQRELTFLLADPERRLLRAIAARLPQGVTSDHLTVLGMFGALGVAAAYALSPLSPGWLWAASACLAVQWLGGSLDGTVARVRGAERPRYGYYLDHVVDAGSTAPIGLGPGPSPHRNPCGAPGGGVGYLALPVHGHLAGN